MSYPVLSKQAFLNWAKSKDPNERYDAGDCYGCALYQYAKFLGFKNVKAGTRGFEVNCRKGIFGDAWGGEPHLISDLNGSEIYRNTYDRSTTFGQLVRNLSD